MSDKTMKIACCGIIALATLVLLVAAVAAGGYFFYMQQDQENRQEAAIQRELEAFTSHQESAASSSSSPNSSVSTTYPTGEPAVLSNLSTAAGGEVAVGLAWNEPVDCDLEIWDSSGKDLELRAFNLYGNDVTNGSDGMEYFLFSNSSDGAYGSGSYVVSVYYAGQNESGIEELDVYLRIITADGRQLRRQKRIFWESGKDQWHAFRIDATSGLITDIDEFIAIQTTE